MDSDESKHRPGPSDPAPRPRPAARPRRRTGPHHGTDPHPAKILVVGGPGSGKTTFLRSVAGQALATPAIHEAGAPRCPRRRSRHAGPLELGRITLDHDLVLYLFSAVRADAGEEFLDELARGAIGAVVLADSRRLQDSFTVLDNVEQRRLPFIVAINRFGPMTHTANDIREALAVTADVPVMFCDARQPLSAKAILNRLVRHTITRTVEHYRRGRRRRRGDGGPLPTDRPHSSSRSGR
jgi:signal recognition particle receptor subunit beta